MKVAIYARVSKDEKAEDNRYQDVMNQISPLREWASRMGWDIIGTYHDQASGADATREGLVRMTRDAMMLKFQSILVWKLDRFSREPLSVVIGRIQKLRERGIGIKSLTEEWLNTSTDSPMADLVLAVMAWAAAEERRKISERTKAGIARKRAIGQWKGGRPKKYREVVE